MSAVFSADYSDDSQTSAYGMSTVSSSSELAQKEKSALQRQLQYQVRQKELLLNPYISGASTAGGVDSLISAEQSEEERLHRYFGAAIALYKENRLEEAVDILQYIVDKYPEDKYAKETLARIRKEAQFHKKTFGAEVKMEAAHIKRNRVTNLIKDGIAYYDGKDFDRALLKFSDVLILDPSNPTAKRYMEGMKKFYSREAKAENIVREWEEGLSGNGARQTTPEKDIRQEAKKLLDKYGPIDKKAEALLASTEKKPSSGVAEKLLDEKNQEDLIISKRAASLLNSVELEDKIKEIINARASEETKSMQFTLGAGDMIQISVRDHPELSGKALVQLSGDINLPLVNDSVMAQGMTVNELTEKVTDVLKRYVQDPYVAVSIIDYKSKIFYVLDENSCTPYPITRAYLTLRDALFMSDWGNNRALGRVLVIKPSKRHPIVKRVDAFELIFRGKLENDVRIEDGDVIYIPMTVMAKVTKSLYDTMSPMRAMRAIRSEYLADKFNEKDWRDIGRMPKNYADESIEAQDLASYGSINTLGDLFLQR